MKTITRALGYALALVQLSGCGSSSDGTTIQGNNKNSCPVGQFLSDDSFNSATLTGHTILFSFNRCKASGTLSECSNGTFRMEITSNTPGLGNLQQCQGIGNYYCEYRSNGSGGYLLICPDGPTAQNHLSTGMLFYPN